PGQVGAETAVRTSAERAVPVRVAVEVHQLRIGEFGGVRVRCAEQRTDPFALADGASAYLDVLYGDPSDAGHRRLPAQQPFDSSSQDVGLLEEVVTVVGVARQVHEEAVERVGDCVQPRDQEQEANVEQLLAGQRLPADVRRDHRGQHVVAWAGDVVVDGTVE